MKQRRYLVTGGAGFIGSHIVDALVALDEDVVVLDDLSTGHRRNLRSDVPVIIGDIRNPTTVHEAMSGVTHVLHQAAIPSVPRSVSNPGESHGVNATGTLNLLLAARDAGVSRFVYASSSAVYGESAQSPKVESMATAPLSPYAVSKLAGEMYAQVFHALYGLETISLRYFNIFGPRQDPASEYAAVIPKFITAALYGERPRVFGDGLQSRDFTYVDDVVAANLKACEAPAGAAGSAYNAACGRSYTLLDMIAALEEIIGSEIESQHDPAQPGDVRHSLADIGSARTALDYHPRVDFQEGLRRTVAFYEENA